MPTSPQSDDLKVEDPNDPKVGRESEVDPQAEASNYDPQIEDPPNPKGDKTRETEVKPKLRK